MNTTNQIAEIKRTSASTLTNTINPWIITQDAYSKLRRRYWSEIIDFFVVYVCVSPSEVWDGSCLSWRTILIYNPLSQSRPAAQGYLGFFWQWISRSSLPSIMMINVQCLNESLITCLCLKTTKTNINNTFFVVLVLLQKTENRERRGALIQGEVLF